MATLTSAPGSLAPLLLLLALHGTCGVGVPAPTTAPTSPTPPHDPGASAAAAPPRPDARDHDAVPAQAGPDAASGVAFSKPVMTGGHSSKPRRDPFLLTLMAADGDWRHAHVLCLGVDQGVDTVLESTDGGESWAKAHDTVAALGPPGWAVPLRRAHAQGGEAAVGSVFGVPQGYVKERAQMAGPWQATG